MKIPNHIRLKELATLAGSFCTVAALIEAYTMRPISSDTIKSWTCDRLSKRARPCPDWAVRTLEAIVVKPPALCVSCAGNQPNFYEIQRGPGHFQPGLL